VTAQPSSFLSIRRQWEDGDRVEMTMPMSLWLCPMPDDANLVAVMYGPLVLAGELAPADVPESMVYTSDNWFKFPPDRIAEAPVIVTAQHEPATWIKPVEGQALTFRTAGVGRPEDVTLVPYYRLWNQKYAIYWQLTDEEGWRRIQAEREARAEAQAQETPQ
jgi:DUF1680 family protein